jgi:hypothetical protein
MKRKLKFSVKPEESEKPGSKMPFYNPKRGQSDSNNLSKKFKETHSFTKSALSRSMMSIFNNQNTSSSKVGDMNSVNNPKRTQEFFEISNKDQQDLKMTKYVEKNTTNKSQSNFFMTDVDKNDEKIPIIPALENKNSIQIRFSGVPKIKEDSNNKNKYEAKLTLKHRETVKRNLDKFSHNKYEFNIEKKNSLAISLEDEIFNVVPELQLLSTSSVNKKENQDDRQNFFKKMRKPKRRRMIFDPIYKIDDEYLEKVEWAKKNKDNFNLLEYQNQLMLLLSYRVCRENLLKLSENLKDIREKANEVEKPPEIKWNEVKEEIESCRVILNKNLYGEYEDLISLNSRYPNKNYENKTLKSVNEKDELVLPKIDYQHQKKKKISNKSKLLRKRDSFLPPYLVEKLNSVLKIKL